VANKLKRRICDKQYAFLFVELTFELWPFFQLKSYPQSFAPVLAVGYTALKASNLQAGWR
jgi:hypothetical protein